MEVKGTDRSEKCGRGRAAECNDHLEKGAAVRERAKVGEGTWILMWLLKFLWLWTSLQKYNTQAHYWGISSIPRYQRLTCSVWVSCYYYFFSSTLTKLGVRFSQITFIFISEPWQQWYEPVPSIFSIVTEPLSFPESLRGSWTNCTTSPQQADGWVRGGSYSQRRRSEEENSFCMNQGRKLKMFHLNCFSCLIHFRSYSFWQCNQG